MSWLKKRLSKIFRLFFSFIGIDGNSDTHEDHDNSPDQTPGDNMSPPSHDAAALPGATKNINGEKNTANADALGDVMNELLALKVATKKNVDDAARALKEIAEAKTLVYFGFIALFFIVVGILYGYWQFISTSSNNEDYKYGFSERINTLRIDYNDLKNKVDNIKIRNPYLK